MCKVVENTHKQDYAWLITGGNMMQEQQNKVEGKMAELNDTLPKIPENGRKLIVEWAPWISLIIGGFGLLSALWLWQWANEADKYVDLANQLSRAYNVNAPTVERLGPALWLALAVLVVQSVLQLAAFPGLKARSKKRGWNLLFYSALLSVAYGVVSAFTNYGGASLIGTLLGAAIGFYILFQIRGHYSEERVNAPTHKTKIQE